MASVVVKTIWQSKEIHEAGDPPAGVESRSQLVPEAPGVASPVKGIAKKKKAVSFLGWVCRTLSGTVLAPCAASSRARVPPWVLQARGGQARGQWPEVERKKELWRTDGGENIRGGGGAGSGRRTQAPGVEKGGS